MADKKISALTAASTPLAGTEVLPIVQSGATVKVANNDLRPKQIQSNATSGVLQITGPASAATRVMTTPDANFTAARTDAAQTFTGDQSFAGDILLGSAPAPSETTAGQVASGNMLILQKSASVVAGGNFDLTINTDTYFGNPGGFSGILVVNATRENAATQSRRQVLAVTCYGTTLTTTVLHTQDGSGGGSTFTLTMFSNGVLRFTDTSGQDVRVFISFFGSKSLA